MRTKKLTKKQLELRKSWEALLKKHSKPLEKGRQSDKKPKHSPLKYDLMNNIRQTPYIPSLSPKNVNVVGKPAYEDETLIKAREKLKSKAVPLYNKGGYGYCTESMEKEMRAGLGRRRS